MPGTAQRLNRRGDERVFSEFIAIYGDLAINSIIQGNSVAITQNPKMNYCRRINPHRQGLRGAYPYSTAMIPKHSRSITVVAALAARISMPTDEEYWPIVIPWPQIRSTTG